MITHDELVADDWEIQNGPREFTLYQLATDYWSTRVLANFACNTMKVREVMSE